MAYLISRAFFALGCGILLLLNMPPATGYDAWTDSGVTFETGLGDGTVLVGDAISLANQSSEADWRPLNSGSPPSRHYHVMAYDSRNDITLMFGGVGERGYVDGTWAFDMRMRTWTERSPPVSPSMRKHSTMTYDRANCVFVLFGGYYDNVAMGDTWTYNYSANEWTEMRPSNAPSARYASSMVYDATMGACVLFGGYSDRGMNDTWLYNLSANAWTELHPSTSPPTREHHAMTFDRDTGKIVLFGGHNSTIPFRRNDTWMLDTSASVWTEMKPSPSPALRGAHTMVYDARGGVSVLFSGWGATGAKIFIDDLWTYNVTTNIWRNMTPSNLPCARIDSAMVYDEREGVSILFGGQNMTTFDDTWSYNLSANAWSNLEPAPYGRLGHEMVYDPAHGVIVLFGGTNGTFPERGETWLFNVSSKRWIARYPEPAPAGRYDHSMAYDTRLGLVVLFGGLYRNDTWTYNVSTNLWSQMSPPISPSPRWEAAMAYDESVGRFVLYGGNDNMVFFNDTWTYDASTDTWTNVTTAASPNPMDEWKMAYDSDREVMVLVGGTVRETWTYETKTNEWRNMNPSTMPSGRHEASIAYDDVEGRVVLFGGEVASTHEYSNETWTYDPGTNVWTNTTITKAPPPRSSHAMTYDSDARAIVMFGGYNNKSAELGDTWIYRSIRTYVQSGTHTSASYDAGGNAFFKDVRWNSTTPVGTSLRFQLRAADSLEGLPLEGFLGPDGSSDSYYDRSGQKIHGNLNGSRWIQYRVYLSTTVSSRSPLLRGVSIGFNLMQEVAIESPTGGENWTGEQWISWKALDLDNDTLAFDIHLSNATMEMLLVGDLPNDTRAWTWDTRSVPNGTYRIRIDARDNCTEIPLTASSVSSEFTISHPAPEPTNHPPRVTMVSPLNNTIVSTDSVRLTWQGTDPDGDRLTYIVRHSSRPFDAGPVQHDVTEAESFVLLDLADGATYWWTIDASDGKNGTAVVAGSWSFTVQLPHPPPINHPPRITSTPPQNVTVGEEYSYDITGMDDDGDVLVLSLALRPQGMTLDPSSGRLRWRPTSMDVGNNSVTIRLGDGRGGVDEQSFVVRVLEEVTPPYVRSRCWIASPANGTKVSGRAQMAGTAMRGSAPLVMVQVRIDNGNWSTAIGLENWTLIVDTSGEANGRHIVEARAYDGSQYSDVVSTEYILDNPEPRDRPGECLSFLIIGASVVIIAIVYFLGRGNRLAR